MCVAGTGGEGILKEVGFPVIGNKICNRPSYLDGRVKDHEMCAGNIEGGSDSCQVPSQKHFILLVCNDRIIYNLHLPLKLNKLKMDGRKENITELQTSKLILSN